MKQKLSLFVFSAVAAAGCASGPFGGGGAAKDVCTVETTEKRTIQVVDGAMQKGKGGYVSDHVTRVEVKPGKHTYTFGSQGSNKTVKLTFECRAGRRYVLQQRAAGADIYGTRWVWMIEDARSKEVLVSE